VHWDALSTSVKDELTDTYCPGQNRDGRLTRKVWHKAMLKARFELREE